MSWFRKGSSDEGEAPQPGEFGPYYLQELINSGGMANIWLATDAQGKAFAVRRLHHRLRFNLAAKRRFLRGCEILSKIHNHEFVIGYEGHGKIEGDLYLLMEYVEGSNLKLLHARSDPVLTENIGNVLIDSAIALEHVHESGFMHLDFKPENVLLTRNASVRLVDFDIAQPKPEQPRKMSDNPGTPAYMAPEQIRRKPIDHRVDIFAFGVAAYELLTSRKPFPGETPEEILRRQYDRSLDFVAPRELNPDIPAALDKAILKCLELEPDERYPYMSVLVRDLQAALYV
jgi:serine/threonine-protein kinase